MSTPVQTNFVDRIVGYFSPRAAVERTAWRQLQASYKGGVPTRTSEGYSRTNGQRFGTVGDRNEIIGSRDRAYQAYDNNPVAKTLVDTETDNVIGDGLNFQPTTDDEAWNREAEDKYYEWRENCSVRGGDVYGGCEMERLLWSRSRVAGDIGWILVNQIASNGFPEPKIQIVSAENIATPTDKQSDLSIYDGIRFDGLGRPTDFYVKGIDDRTGIESYTAIAARDFVWLPHMTKPNQSRPPSAYATIQELLSQLDRYVDGVSLAAWMATVFGLIFKEPNAAKQVNGLPLIPNSQGTQSRALTLEGAQVKYMAPEGEVVQVDAKQPMQHTPEFIRAMYRMLGQPFDMPLEVLAKDMSTCTFASARIGLLPFYRSCRVKAGRFGSRWSRTIRWWLSRERLRSDDDPKRWKTPFPVKFWSHDLLVNAWDYTDPVSEVQGDILQIDAGLKSTPMVIGERGRDAARILRERTEWQDKTKDLPQVRSTMTRDPLASPTTPTADENDTAFKRDVVKAFLADGTVNDVIYNVTDIPSLLVDSGLPLDPSVNVTKGEGVPFLPVVAATGPLVSGDTIQDPQGDLVGGDIENNMDGEATTDASKAAAAQDGLSNGDGGQQDENDPAGDNTKP